MDFFGFNAAADFSSPVGMLVKSATDPLLMGPDWGRNMDICDLINSSRDPKEVETAAGCILRRLQESDPKIVSLALTLTETCTKNCAAFPAQITQQYMDEIVGITHMRKGKQNAQDALKLIQQWGKGFEQQKHRVPIFYDTYLALQAKGANFAAEDETAPSAAFDLAVSASSAVEPGVDFSVTNQHEFDKLERDLSTVLEKVKLCREMLAESSGIDEDDALAEVIGFLEACRDRMGDLIEAGTQGLLGESLLEKCLKVNDAIFRTLEAEKTGAKIPVEEEHTAPGASTSSAAQAGNLLDLDETTGELPKPAPSSVKAALVDDDDFGSLQLRTGGPMGRKPLAAPPSIHRPLPSTAPPATAPAPAGTANLLDFDGGAGQPPGIPIQSGGYPPQPIGYPIQSAPSPTFTSAVYDPFAPTPPMPPTAPPTRTPAPPAGNIDPSFDEIFGAPAAQKTTASVPAAPATTNTATSDFDSFLDSLSTAK